MNLGLTDDSAILEGVLPYRVRFAPGRVEPGLPEQDSASRWVLEVLPLHLLPPGGRS